MFLRALAAGCVALAAACVAAPPPPLTPKVPPAAEPPEKLVDLGALSTVAESEAARPAWTSAAARPAWASVSDAPTAGVYAPSLDQLPTGMRTLEKLDRDLDHDLLFCYADGPDTYGARFEVTGDVSGARVARPSGVLAKAFTLPLWSMRRGDALTVTLVRDKKAPVTTRATFDGRVPIVATGGADTVTCNVVDRESIARDVTQQVRDVDAELNRAARGELDVALGFGRPMEGPTPIFGAAGALTEIAALVGWAHPIVRAADTRLQAAAATWSDARAALFQTLYERAHENREGTVLTDVSVRVTRVACDRGQRVTPIESLPFYLARGVLTLGLADAPTLVGCAFDVELHNAGASDVAMKACLLDLRLVTSRGAWFVAIEQHSGPPGQVARHPMMLSAGETLSYRLYARVDPATLAGERVLLVSTDGAVRETVRPVARIR